MAVTLTYETGLSRVKILADTMPGAQIALVERSTDQIRWTTVRGGTAVVVAAGATPVPLYDYEFAPNVANYYRVTPDRLTVVTDTYTRSVTDGFGTADSGQTYTLEATAADYDVDGSRGTIQPTGLADDRSAVIDTNTINVDMVGVFRLNTLPGTSTIQLGLEARRTDEDNRYYCDPQVAVGGAVTLRLRKRVASTQTTLATVATGITMTTATDHSVRFAVDGSSLRGKFWLSSDPEPSTWLEATDTALATGDFAGVFCRNNTAVTTHVVSVDNLTVYDLSPASQVDDITPTLTDVWLKSVSRPFLNTTVAPLGSTFAVERSERSGLFDVVGRSLPVAVSDVRGSRRYSLTLRTDTEQDADDLDLLFASGDILFLHAPAGRVVPAGGVYLRMGLVRAVHPAPARPLRLTEAAATEVAAPGPDVVGAQSTCQTVINTYATVTDLIAAHATCADVLTLIGDGSEVLVP